MRVDYAEPVFDLTGQDLFVAPASCAARRAQGILQAIADDPTVIIARKYPTARATHQQPTAATDRGSAQ
jgi:hypothetical protein